MYIGPFIRFGEIERDRHVRDKTDVSSRIPSPYCGYCSVVLKQSITDFRAFWMS